MAESDRWALDAEQLPVYRRLTLLTQAVGILLSRTAKSEAEATEWKNRLGAMVGYPARLEEPALMGLADVPLVRLYPAHPERFPLRPRVEDGALIPRLLMESDHDYGTALTRHWRAIGTGFLLLEWDVAIDAGAYLQMCAYVASDPEAMWAAPYYLYSTSGSLNPPGQVPDPESVAADGTLPYVPFGCTYFPGWVLERLATTGADATIQYPTPDHVFNPWATTQSVRRRLAYYCRPMHLHPGGTRYA